jgi:hypothetical protein
MSATRTQSYLFLNTGNEITTGRDMTFFMSFISTAVALLFYYEYRVVA